MFRCVAFSLLTIASAGSAFGQRPAVVKSVPAVKAAPAGPGALAAPAELTLPAAPGAPASPSAPPPTWETQKQARTYLLGIPAPRGQIVDRNGSPLAQTRVSYNLAIAFPTPLAFSDREVVTFARAQVIRAQALLGRVIGFSADAALKHYKNRGVVPFVIVQDLRANELDLVRLQKPENLSLQPVYQRYYPNGSLGGHIIGYAGREGRIADGPIENNELLWPNAEGRDGLEQSFDEQLQGKIGQYNISFDASGKKASERISIPPQPGYNVVTTLDARIQRLCEESLAKGCKRGAIVILDPNNGDILALASWPTINPNAFIPNISADAFRVLQEDKDIPLLPRAFRTSYPAGSTFKVFVGLAALQSGKIKPEDEFSCPPALEIGNLTFKNWKKDDAGSLTFVGALTQSCNTWFYQVGMKLGSRMISDYAQRLGLGSRTGIPLKSETEGRIPNDEYMMKTHQRRMGSGDVANFSIGQGDVLISPLQMAQAMATVGNGGTLYQTRLVQQVQGIDGQIIHAYDVRARSQIDITKEVMLALRTAMVQVVEGGLGTAHQSQVPNVHVAGKTGTAQWGPKNKERTAAWFAGFAPSEKPKYAFAALYEGDANNNDVHGGTYAAPLIGKVLKELFKDEPKEKSGKKKRPPVEETTDAGVPVRKAEPVKH